MEELNLDMDLGEYAVQIARDLQAEEDATIPVYLEQQRNIKALHGEINECDDILASNAVCVVGYVLVWFECSFVWYS